MAWRTVESLPRAYNAAVKPALLKQQFSDFLVNEVLLAPPSGEGEHCYLQLRKTNANTLWVRDQLAKFAQVKSNEIGYAGLKDRHGITTQWMSVPIRQGQLPWQEMDIEGVEFLQAIPNQKKLQVGQLQGNEFEIILRDVQANQETLAPVFEQIKQSGVPNYFMSQRFGHGMGNLDKALQMFQRTIRVKQKKPRGLYLSAARSYLFNLVLAKRIDQNNWRDAIQGDLLLTADNEICPVDAIPANVEGLVTGPMWGRGRLATSSSVAALEMQCAQTLPELIDGLEHAGLSQDRRVLSVPVNDFVATWLTDSDLQLTFSLRAGAYATAVLREICEATEGADQ